MLSSILNFNSIKVRLKLALAAALGSAAIFQFHKGTIKTECSKGSADAER